MLLSEMYTQLNNDLIEELNISAIGTIDCYELDRMLHSDNENWETQRLVILLWMTMSKNVQKIAKTLKKEQVLEAYYLLKNKNITRVELYMLFITFKDNKDFCKELLMHPLVAETQDLLSLIFATINLTKEVAIARNCNIPSSFLEKLDYKDFHVANVLIHNPNITTKLKKSIYYSHNENMVFLKNKILNDPDWEFRKIAIESYDTIKAILLISALDENSEVRATVAKHKNTMPETLAKLAFDSDLKVREAVASNHNTPIDTLEYLSNTTKISLLNALASNKRSTPDILQTITKNFIAQNPSINNYNNYLEKEFLFSVVKHDNGSNETIFCLLSWLKNKEYYSKQQIINHTIFYKNNLNIEVFKYIIENFNDVVDEKDIFRNIVSSKVINPEMLEYIYLKIKNQKNTHHLLANIANHVNTPFSILEELALDHRITVLKGLAKNKTIPDNIKHTLRQKNLLELDELLDIDSSPIIYNSEPINTISESVVKQKLLINSVLESDQYTFIQEALKQHPFFRRFNIIRLNNDFSWYQNTDNSFEISTFDFESGKSVAKVAKVFAVTEEKHGNPKDEKTISVLNSISKKQNSLESLNELLSVTVQFPQKNDHSLKLIK
ncbi:MAG: HEAT repeat domain-containing protein [Culicoidibacterales bacterium]